MQKIVHSIFLGSQQAVCLMDKLQMQTFTSLASRAWRLNAIDELVVS